jgi:hypothetical protein
MGLTLEAVAALKGRRVNGEGVFHPAPPRLRANDDSALEHLRMCF